MKKKTRSNGRMESPENIAEALGANAAAAEGPLPRAEEMNGAGYRTEQPGAIRQGARPCATPTGMPALPGGEPPGHATRRGGLGALMQEVEPWPEAVEGAVLLDELSQLLSRHVVVPEFAADTLALWILHTYAFELRDVGTYIGVESPEKRCGKTTLLNVLSKLVRRAVVAANISAPAFFRVIEEARPTLLIDEADTFLRGNNEIRGILNAGYLRETAYVLRVASARGGTEGETPGDEGETGLGLFSCWCPKVMCLIGRLPETLADRCIVIRMQRKLATENCERLRKLRTEEARRKCARFVEDNARAIAAAEPLVPESLHDRAGDIWEPLLALADLAGGDWPERARRAAIGLTTSAQENCPIGTLLFDAYILFLELKVERMFSRQLAAELNNSYLNRPWKEALKGKLVTDTWLARLLRPYGMRPSTMRIGEEVGRGYQAEDFVHALQRYVPKAEAKAMLNEAYRPQILDAENEPSSDSLPAKAVSGEADGDNPTGKMTAQEIVERARKAQVPASAGCEGRLSGGAREPQTSVPLMLTTWTRD